MLKPGRANSGSDGLIGNTPEMKSKSGCLRLFNFSVKKCAVYKEVQIYSLGAG